MQHIAHIPPAATNETDTADDNTSSYDDYDDTEAQQFLSFHLGSTPAHEQTNERHVSNGKTVFSVFGACGVRCAVCDGADADEYSALLFHVHPYAKYAALL